MTIAYYAFWIIYTKIFYLGESFAYKTGIYSKTWDYLINQFPFNMIGFGLQNSFDLYGIYSHSFFSNILSEVGIIGLFLHIFLMYRITHLTKGVAIFFYIPLLITGLSYANAHTFTYFYFFIVLSYLVLKFKLERQRIL